MGQTPSEDSEDWGLGTADGKPPSEDSEEWGPWTGASHSQSSAWSNQPPTPPPPPRRHDVNTEGDERPKRSRPKRQPGAKRRGQPRVGRRPNPWPYATAIGSLPVAKGFSMCQANEEVTNVLAFSFLVVMLFFVLVLVWLCKRRATTKKDKVKPKVGQHKVKLPPMVYFSTTAVARHRSFHALDSCHAVKRANSFCSATACKFCVDSSVFESASLD